MLFKIVMVMYVCSGQAVWFKNWEIAFAFALDFILFIYFKGRGVCNCLGHLEHPLICFCLCLFLNHYP